MVLGEVGSSYYSGGEASGSSSDFSIDGEVTEVE